MSATRRAITSAPGTSGQETPLPLLVVHDLHVDFITRDGTVRALNGVSVSVDSGQVLALLGESGSGKSVTLRSILGLHPRGNTRVTGEVLLKGHDVNAMSDGERRAYRGRVVSMVFQELGPHRRKLRLHRQPRLHRRRRH
jgi:ABC-type glutathione transport system ATPase component